jgi:CRP-like cAMP-binding protein
MKAATEVTAPAALENEDRHARGVLSFSGHPRTGGAYDSQHRTARIAGCTRRYGRVAGCGTRAAADTNHLISPRDEYCGAGPMYANPDQDQHRRNRLLAALRPGDYALLEPHLQIVPIAEGEFLHLPGEAIEQVYFLHRGIVALMAISEDGDAIATASVGSEGAIGTIAGTGFVRAFTRAMVQAAGVASRIAVPHFRRAVSKSDAINDLLTRYHMALMCQVQQTSLCNSVHDATSRLSRLLLVLSEQSEEGTISFSQERLADMLGLRRSSVTVAAQTLQSRRFISYRRGRIEIVNRKGLKAAACECYEVVSRTFDQFLEDKQVTR